MPIIDMNDATVTFLLVTKPIAFMMIFFIYL